MYTVTAGNEIIAEHLTMIEASIMAEQIRKDVGDYEIHIMREEEWASTASARGTQGRGR